jgi:NHLM bacteriocin system ABC transporter ATP-binding protein
MFQDMSGTEASRIKGHGTVLELAPNAVFSIEDPEKVWVVLAGTLDLFLADVREDDSIGPRSHILRVQKDGAMFGFNRQTGARAGLFANPGPNTRVLCLEKGHVEQMGGSLEGHPLLPLMEQWVTSLSTAAADRIAPKFFVVLDNKQDVKFEDSSGAVLPLEKLVWVRAVEGSAHFLGSQSVPALDPRHYFPVARGIWLECAPHTTLECIDSELVLQQDPDWSGLHAFSDLIWAYLICRRRNRDEKERERIVARAAADSLTVDSALLAMAAPLREAGKELPIVDAGGDPLLRACERVGRAAGIAIQPPVGILRGIKQRDPVSAIAKASGVRVRLVLLRDKWWKQDNGPLLGFLAAENRPVALLPRSTTSYHFFDSTLHQTVNVTEVVAKDLKEVAYVFYRPFPARQIKVADLFAFALRGGRRDIVAIVLMGIATGLLAMLTPILTGIIFDDIIPGAQRHALTQLTAFLVISAFATALFSLTRQFAVLRLEGKMDASTQAAVWDRTIALPVPFFRNYTAGDLAMRGLVIGQIRQILTGSTLSSILSGIFSVFSLVLLFWYSWQLAIVATALIAVAVSISFTFGYFQISCQRDILKQQGRISGMMLQFIGGIAKFRVSGTEARVFAVWAREFTKQKLIYLRARKLSNALSIFDAVFPVAAYGALFYCLAYLLSTLSVSQMTTGEFLAFFAAFTQFLAAALALSSSAVSMLAVIPLLERAKPILETLPEADSSKSDPGELSGRIEMNHVVFRYRENMPLVLKDISLSVSPGQFVAFVGASGSGKSTLLRLLLGFEKPESGAIYFDSQDLAGLDLQAVRRQLGVVLQNGRVLPEDIFTNIVGAAPLTFDDAWEAARLSGFDRDIEQMPMGMHTMVSEGGGGLSGGQRQRLMIARAIVGKPRIFLFDEATSALDNQTQAIVSKSLENLNATRIVIAHRLSTVINADRIFVMDKGRIVQNGTYSELMKEEGVFTELAKRQLS